MRQRFASLTGALSIPAPLTDADSSIEILRLWRDLDPAFLPERLDSQEPIREPLRPSALEQSRAGRFGSVWYATRRSPAFLAIFRRGVAFEDGALQHAALRFFVYDASRIDENATRLARLLDAIAASFGADYGMVHAVCGSELAEAMISWRPDIDSGATGAHAKWGYTAELQTGLPTLYWRTTLGRPYIEIVGEDRLLSTPAYRVEATSYGVNLQLTASVPSDHTFSQFREARARAMEHLGRGVFRGSSSTAADIPVFAYPRRL